MNKIRFFDATLRDGSHANKHQFDEEQIRDYCRAIDRAGMYTVVVGHGNGLGASSLQVGLSKLSDTQMLTTARRELLHTKLGAYLIPGFGTIHDDITPAIEAGVDVFKVGCQCTEADVTKEHINHLRNCNKEVYGVLMMYHMTTTERLVEEAQKMQGYGAHGVIIMDSAGASTPEMVKRTISALYDHLSIDIGFHAHNNLGLAVGNTYEAIRAGASIIDGTIRGFGAGAGNCPLEVIAALLEKEGMEDQEYMTPDLYAMMDTSEQVVKAFLSDDKGLADISIVSGMAGVFSAFKAPVMRIAHEFHVDPRDIFRELGERKAMAGQEDMIIDVAVDLQRQKNQNDSMSF